MLHSKTGSELCRLSTGELSWSAVLSLLILTRPRYERKPMAVSTISPKSTGTEFNLRRIVVVAIFVSLATTTAFAQFTASIQGNVRDSSGANIPDAQMILINTATKVQQAGATDASG